jgi:glycosyltransferase involved in cell wall biosynthesis
VVGTRVGGIPEQLGSDAGVLVESEDVDGLVEAVLSLAGSEQLRSSLGAAARRRVGELFSVERQASALDQVYRSALGGAPAA